MLIATLIVFQIIIFFALVVLLRKVLSKNVSTATQHLDDLGKDYVIKEKEIDRKLEAAKDEANKIVMNAKLEAAKIKEGVVKEADVERDKIITQARTQSTEIMKQTEGARQNLLAELDNRIKKEAIDKSKELISSVIPDEIKEDIHKLWLKDLIENNFNQLERLPVEEDIKVVKIESALALSDEQKSEISQKVKEIVGHEVDVDEKVETKLIAGMKISIGSLVLDGSMLNSINEKVKDARAK